MKNMTLPLIAAVAAISATPSFADVTFGGYGRFGVMHIDDDSTGISSTDVTSRFRLQIDATAEADNGVIFGARARIQQNNTDNQQSINAGPDGVLGTADDFASNSGPAGTGLNGIRYFARYGSTEFGVGNIYGALETMPGQYPIDLGLTSLGFDYTAYAFRADAYSSTGAGASGANGVEVLHRSGDLEVHVSASETNDRIAGYAAYDYQGWTFALGLQDSNNPGDTELTASASGQVGLADVTVAYADNGIAGDHFVVAGRFDVGSATAVEAYVADAQAFDKASYGVGVHHDLGGGTSFRSGIASLGNKDVRADAGVRFNF
ncbi:porin [Sulfitobacter sp. 1A13421]|uniref:porin n=1 Tax=Sulfitobacter sp. 1A13421 TaxID=3368595 RepID=UPI0037467A90